MINKALEPRKQIKEIAMGLIDEPSFQVRSKIDPDQLIELGNSIREVGQLQPISVFRKADRFEIIYGHRRFLAAERLGKTTIEAIIYEDRRHAELMKIHENAFREAVNAVDEAVAIHNLMLSKPDLKSKDVAKMLSRSEGYVSQRLSILKWPDMVKESLTANRIGFSVARELVRISDEATLKNLLYYAENGGCSPSTARRWAEDWLSTQTPQTPEGEGGADSPPSFYAPIESVLICQSCHNPIQDDPRTLIVCSVCYEALLKAIEMVANDNQ